MIQKPVIIYHGNDYEWREIGRAPSSEACKCAITAYVEIVRNMRVYYKRGWMTDKGEMMIDYGSHVNFIKLVPMDKGAA
jgi:hypothetical protein